MSRQLRADFDGALHHVYNRGIDGRDIFLDDEDRLFFLHWLGQMVEKFGWIVHAWTLMSNHFHLMIETPNGGLSRGRSGNRVTSSLFVPFSSFYAA